MKVRVLRTAVEDLAAGQRFYERQRKGVGDYFLAQLFEEIDSLAMVGGAHRLHAGFNRLLATRFPYAVYYRVVAGEILVFRVLDCRRDPKALIRALRQEI